MGGASHNWKGCQGAVNSLEEHSGQEWSWQLAVLLRGMGWSGSQRLVELVMTEMRSGAG